MVKRSPSPLLWALRSVLRPRKSGTTLTLPLFFLTVWQHEAYWLVEGAVAPALYHLQLFRSVVAYGGDVRGAVGVLEFKSSRGSSTSGHGFGVYHKDLGVFFKDLYQYFFSVGES